MESAVPRSAARAAKDGRSRRSGNKDGTERRTSGGNRGKSDAGTPSGGRGKQGRVADADSREEVADQAAEQVARETWTAIGNEFNKLRASNRSHAYQRKQQRINENFGILSAIMSPKDLLEEARRCEEFMSTGETHSHAGNALDELSDFLNGKNVA